MLRKKSTIKKLFSIILVLVLTLSMNSIVFAATTENSLWVVMKDNENNVYLQNTKNGNQMVEAFTYDEFGNLVKINLVEYAKLLNSTPITESKQIAPSLCPKPDSQPASITSLPINIYTYVQTASYTCTGTASKVTPTIVGPGNITYGTSITTTEQFNASGTLAAEAKKVIKGSVTFGWTKSTASATVFNAAFPIPAGRSGFVQFTPWLYCTTGSLRSRMYIDNVLMYDNVETIAAYCPKSLGNGITDGVFAVIFII